MIMALSFGRFCIRTAEERLILSWSPGFSVCKAVLLFLFFFFETKLIYCLLPSRRISISIDIHGTYGNVNFQTAHTRRSVLLFSRTMRAARADIIWSVVLIIIIIIIYIEGARGVRSLRGHAERRGETSRRSRSVHNARGVFPFGAFFIIIYLFIGTGVRERMRARRGTIRRRVHVI